MALNIQIPYRGDQYLFQGISQAGQGIAAGIEQMTGNLKKAKAMRTMAVDALGMDADSVDKMSLPELEGHFQAVAVKGAMENQRAQAEQRKAQAAHLMMQNDEAEAGPRFAQEYLKAQQEEQPGPPQTPGFNPMAPGQESAPMTDGTGTDAGGPPPTPGFNPNLAMKAVTRMGATSPKLAGIILRQLMQQGAMGGGAGMQFVEDPKTGARFMLHDKTVMRSDQPAFDTGDMLNAPEGYSKVWNGRTWQYLRSPQQNSKEFDKTMGVVNEDMAKAAVTLNRADATYESAQKAKEAKEGAQRRRDTALNLGRATIDHYHARGSLTDEQRDQFYEQLGMGKATKGTEENPTKPMSQKEFDALKAGSWFVNPKDNRVLQKK